MMNALTKLCINQPSVAFCIFQQGHSLTHVAYAVSNAAKFCAKPANQFWKSAKRIM